MKSFTVIMDRDDLIDDMRSINTECRTERTERQSITAAFIAQRVFLTRFLPHFHDRHYPTTARRINAWVKG